MKNPFKGPSHIQLFWRIISQKEYNGLHLIMLFQLVLFISLSFVIYSLLYLGFFVPLVMYIFAIIIEYTSWNTRNNKINQRERL